MPINIVSGLTNRLAGLVQVWSDYRDLYDRKTAAEEAAAPQHSPVENPQQALVHPSRGARWFAACFPRVLQRRTTNPNAAAKALAAEHLDASGFHDDAYADHEPVLPVPRNERGDQPIEAERAKTLRTGEAPECEDVATPLLGHEMAWRRYTENLSDIARKAIGQRIGFFLQCQRQQALHDNLRGK